MHASEHAFEEAVARLRDCRAYGLNSASGATGEGSQNSRNGRATSDGAGGGVSGDRK